ncbi:MAG: dihydroorotase [Methylococcales symbiont of Hymedesmia sp. n. MRB-2018]|nr:MAG: dihydroorotase [Methylococcales symbiont of Hymedesmia sp. n. MRB-2018]KAF3983910.1 MAG: dihydroorotase [Methylococcales symbiont of Hymedesmia sp. n. MRB-2018]
MKKIHITNGRIIDPANHIDQTGSLYIADGKILSVLNPIADFSADISIDATNNIVCPGFIDLSVRLRDPGQTHKGTLQSETIAAASAGVTGLCLPPDTQPVIDTQAVTELINDKAEKANYSQVYPIAALTYQLAGKELSSMATLKQAGCVAVSNANAPLANLLVLRRAMEYASSHNLLVILHPEEHSLNNNGCTHEGFFSTRYGLPGIPEASESIAVAQYLELARLTGCRLHFSQISCKAAVIKIQQAKKYGINITADVAIHQLHLTENDIEPFNSSYHVIPPFRTTKDLQKLREGLANGTINAICSDHQPHDLDAKLGAFPETEPGIASVETLLPLMLCLVEDNTITLSQGIACLSQNPASILGINSGALTPGFNADVCIFNAALSWAVNQQNWKSAGLNTPYWGEVFKGRVTHTLQSGKIIYTLE